MLFCMLYYENSNMDSQGNNNTDSFETLICAAVAYRKPIKLSCKNLFFVIICGPIICDVLRDLAPFVQF